MRDAGITRSSRSRWSVVATHGEWNSAGGEERETSCSGGGCLRERDVGVNEIAGVGT